MKSIARSAYTFMLGALLYLLSFSPSFAQTPTPTPTPLVTCPSTIRNLSALFNSFTCFITKIIIPALFAAALAAFIYGVVMYVINAGNSEKRTEGSKFMIWGIVALFVMISVWALVGVVNNTFGLDYTTRPTMNLPKLQQ